jgi:hypothetical protein
MTLSRRPPAVDAPGASEAEDSVARDALTFLGSIQSFVDQIAGGVRGALAARARGDAAEWNVRRAWAASQLELLVCAAGALARRMRPEA